MLSRNQEKHIRSLHQTKYRHRYGQFIAEGSTLVLDLLASGMKVESILAQDTWIARNTSLPVPSSKVVAATQEQMNRVTTLASPSEVLGIFIIPTEQPIAIEGDLMLFLDAIRDPGNLGSILRIADWFGIKQVMLSPDCVDPYNPKAVQASMGSIARVNLRTLDLPELMKLGHDIPLVGTTLSGQDLYAANLPANAILIIGNESHGLRPEFIPMLHLQVRIPDYAADASQKAESLNAAVATAIVCAEFRRRLRT